MKNIIRDKFLLIILLISLIFIFIYSSFIISTGDKFIAGKDGQIIFNWPDEMANYFFINKFYQTNDWRYLDELNLEYGALVHPRSINIYDNFLVPIGFTGFVVIYGLLTKILGLKLILFATPILAVVNAILFYLIINFFFNKKIALISSLLMLTFYAYWYYSSMVMLPNILFITLFFASVWTMIKSLSTNKYIFLFLAGLFLGLTISVRTSEVFTCFILGVVFAIFVIKQKISQKIVKIICFVATVLLIVLLFLLLNNHLYGGLFNFGYYQLNNNLDFNEKLPSEFEIGQNNFFAIFKMIFLPFGWHEYNIINNFLNYLVLFNWPYFVLMLSGVFVWFLQKNKNIRQIVFFIVSFVIASFLIIYYGSWHFSDDLVWQMNTISNSFTRYWLLIYLLMLPWIGYLFVFISELRSINKILKILAISFLGLYLSISSLYIIYLTPGDGLLAQKKVIADYYIFYHKIKNQLPSESLIITDRTDKILFPTFRVIEFNLNYNIFPKLRNMVADGYQIFYLTNKVEKDIEYINNHKIENLKIALIKFKMIDNEYSLYQLKIAN